MYVITDIDGTISDHDWRLNLINSEGYESYHGKLHLDSPKINIVKIINRFHDAGLHIIALTGRPETWRYATNQWLMNHCIKVDQLIMRPDRNFKKVQELKINLMKEHKIMPHEILCAFEDNDKVIEAYREHFITVFKV